jgi:FKBP-type peptidyl-prolyl cis-trans isomerase FkpA
MLKKIAAGLLILGSFTGCLKNADVQSPCHYDACDFKAPASEIQAVEAYLTANNIIASQHCSGLYYAVEVAGTGATPQNCSNITVNYEGRLTDGTLFDASSAPVTFNLSQVINGWRNGLPLVKAGGRINLYIPPSLAYGNVAQGSIPANSILVFKVDLIAVQ